MKHIEAGVRELRKCIDEVDEGVLVFSGGAVKGGLVHGGVRKEEVVGRKEVRSEAAGYLVSILVCCMGMEGQVGAWMSCTDGFVGSG